MPKKSKDLNHYFSAYPKSKAKLGIIRTYLRGKPFEFLTDSGVFSKRRVDLGTRLLIESMVLPEEGCILDVGCGYGAVGIAAATFNGNLRVIMTDVNKRACWLAKRNIEIHSIGNAEVRRGDLYEPVRDMTFDCILSNPPVSAGMETVKSIVVEAPKYMVTKASFQMVIRSKIGRKNLKMLFQETFGDTHILARKSGYRVFISEKQ